MTDAKPAKRTPKPKPPPDPNKLAREQAGAYRTGDGRFTVRQDHGGKWYATDSEQTNELGLELVLGPFGTIAEAKAAVETQREQPAGASPGAKICTLVQGDRDRPKPATRSEPRANETDGAAAPRPESGAKSKASKAEPRHKTSEPTKPAPEPGPKKPAASPESQRTPQRLRSRDPERERSREPEREREPEPPPVDYQPAPWRPTGDERDAVAGAFRRINDAWVTSDVTDMRDFLDPDVVFVQPGFAGRAEGRDAAIASFREFVAGATLHAYAESDLSIDVRGHSAVVSYRFEIEYTLKRKRLRESGRDLFVFNRTGTRWRAVWRLLLPDSDA